MLESEFKRTFLHSVKRKVVGVAERILVHTASLIVAIGASKTVYEPTFHASIFGSVVITFMMYVGLVSLFPAGNPRRTDWFVPFLMACVLGGVCYINLLPWQFIVFRWGRSLGLCGCFAKKTGRPNGLSLPGFFCPLPCIFHVILN